MGTLYAELASQAPASALRVVDSCVKELPEFQAVAANPDDYARMLEFAVFLRRRTLELAPNDHPLTGDDLAIVGAFGAERGGQGISLPAARSALALHAAATLREIHETCGPADLDEGMHLLGWLGRQAPIAQQAYLAGVLRGQNRHRPVIGEIGRFVGLALAGDPAAPGYARKLGIAVLDHWQVVVIRAPGPGEPDEAAVELVWRRHRAPATWHRPGELVVLLPADQETAAPALVREVADIVGRPCAAGTATGPLSTLAETFELARRVSQAVPPRTRPDHLCTMADLFIEIAVAELPELDRWLRDLAARLATGPDLRATLDAYYRHDLDRSRTAAALNVHPRTLDYRLQRAHQLTGVDPRTVNGIRVFTTAVTLDG
ncbi:MAG TPA: helix-turn-helix domain-containing protein [Actinophytocola sp.]|uniref:PucR family transcriptional regulator n=1 Tax=Actinophytocola sp. TaxID=1872138 RepID=UPI002DBE8106|nr:helix-turn-helix domain-containing protein [Actinophytocola sp.]HEU5474369.1 helix-turn-helix domain-containing protein [Actinophytocola sp.]